MSDLHLEFEKYANTGQPKCPLEYFSIPASKDDADTILVLAGDIGVIRSVQSYLYFIEDCASRFRKVLWVMGNHEFYNGSLSRGIDKLREKIAHTGAIVLQNDSLKIDDVTFIGTTLWSSFDNGNPLTMLAATAMTDYKLIRTGLSDAPYKRKIKPADTHVKFLDARAYLESVLYNVKIRDGEKCVVITHHAPSFMSVNEAFIGDALNGCYTSELSDLIADQGPDLWIHGHMHDSVDYTICNTRVVSNPRGYNPFELNAMFDPTMIVEV